MCLNLARATRSDSWVCVCRGRIGGGGGTRGMRWYCGHVAVLSSPLLGCAFYLPPPVCSVLVPFLSLFFLSFFDFLFIGDLANGIAGPPQRILDRVACVTVWRIVFTFYASRPGATRRVATVDSYCRYYCVDIVHFASPTATSSA